jgi:hypothetical protein
VTVHPRGVRRRSGPPPAPSRPARPPTGRGEAGSLSLEAVLVLPVLALLVVVLLDVAALARDVLVAHEAARVGVRVAATTTGAGPVVAAARAAAPELHLEVEVVPATRRDGDLARVTVTVRRRVVGTSLPVRATAVARVEPAVGTVPPAGPDP